MALDRENFLKLAKTVASANRAASTAYSFNGENFSYTDLNETLRQEFVNLAGTYELYRQNKNLVFELIETTINDVLPRKVLEAYGQFAEIKTFAQGEKPVFINKITAASRQRAKSFVTKVGLAGVYEVFKLAGKTYEIPVTAIGGAAQIGFEEFLDGRVDFNDLVDIVMEGMSDEIYKMIAAALIASVSNLPNANKKLTETAFVETDFDKLIAIADAYGKATIYCTFEFASTMVPSSGWISEEHKNERWARGYIANYKGHQVVILPQSFTDNTNATKVIDPSYAFIIASSDTKPVKVAFEGETHAREAENHDWSREIQIYRKVGVGVIINNSVCVYRNTNVV